MFSSLSPYFVVHIFVVFSIVCLCLLYSLLPHILCLFSIPVSRVAGSVQILLSPLFPQAGR